MTLTIRPGFEGEQWARFGQAEQLDDSRGERKLRVELTKLFGDKLADPGKLDIAHHLSIALQEDEIHSCVETGETHFKAGWRGVAVKIRETQTLADKVEEFKVQKNALTAMKQLSESLNTLTQVILDENRDLTSEEKEKFEEISGLLNKESQKIKGFENSKQHLVNILGEENVSKIIKDEEVDLSQYDDTIHFNSYVVLNINSLAKRLGIAKETIKQHEGEGNVDELIRTRLVNLAEEQEIISQMVREMKDSLDNGRSYAFRSDSFSPEIVRDYFEKFIQENISGANSQLVQKFCEDLTAVGEERETKEKREQARQFLNTLSSKIWWESEKLNTPHEKVALSQESIGSFSDQVVVYHGKALDRAGHLGKPMNRMQFFPWDKENRYAIAVGDYVYSRIPMDCPANMVPLRIFPKDVAEAKGTTEMKFILVNVHSLSRLGLDEKTVRQDAASGRLYKTIQEKVAVLNAFNEHFEEDFPIGNNPHWVTSLDAVDFLEDYCLQHPDDEVRVLFQEAADLLKKDFGNFTAHLNALRSKLQGLRAYSKDVIKQGEIDEIERDAKNPSHFGSSLIPKTVGLKMEGTVEEAEFPFGVGRIPVKDFKTYIGTAAEIKGSFPHPGHAGKEMQRISFFPWDKNNLFALACSKRVYVHKPAYHPSNVAPMKLFDDKGDFQGWLLVNVHSLGRLGITPDVIDTAVLDDLLNVEVARRLEAIYIFNQTYQDLEKVDVNVVSTRLLNLLTVAMHPNPVIKEILVDAQKIWNAIPSGDKAARFPDFKETLKTKLLEAGVIEVKEV